MMQADIEFTWWRERNPRNYDEWGPALPPRRSLVDVVIRKQEPLIRAKGASLERYQPLKEFPDLFENSPRSNPKTTQRSLLGHSVRLLLGDGRMARATVFLLAMSQAHNMKASHLHVGFVVSSLDAKLVADHNGIRLRVEPPDLLSALWLQFADAAAKGLANRCKQCGALFATGPDAGRRRGAEFCSIECKSKFHSLVRSRKRA